jgi:hypothetical protein
MSVLDLSMSGSAGKFWPCVGKGLFIPRSISIATTDIHPHMNHNARDGWDNHVRLLGIGGYSDYECWKIDHRTSG